MDFLIFYEHIVREYENALLIKKELESRGYSVKIVNTVSVEYWSSLISRPKVIVVPALYDTTIAYYYSRFFFKKPEKIVNIQCEQVLSKSWEEIGYHNPKGEANKGYHLCWSEASYSRLSKQGVENRNLEKVGPIQFDLLRPEFKEYFLSKSELAKKYNLSANKKWILYVSSFTYPSFDEKEMQVHLNKNKGIGELRDSMQHARDKTLEWVGKLLQKSPETIYIYRPHPSEYNDKSIQKMEEEYEGFHVIREESVKQWIIASDIVNTWYSTSIMEAYYANKPCLVIRPSCPPAKYDAVLYENCSFIDNEVDFLNENSKTNFDDFVFPIDRKLIKYYYGDPSDKPVYITISDYLEKVLQSEDYSRKFDFKGYKNRKKVWKFVIRSLYGDFTRYTGIKLSKILPFKKAALINAEEYASQFNVKYFKHIENKISKITKEIRQSNIS